ncbi:MAG: hypothetical protein APF81_23415 [Desulfosporosinus sp. BRH_c37]|nr:MAG: hypothetical protein APF81_23415 [Desulfosporosinus sp. BRH_c37]
MFESYKADTVETALKIFLELVRLGQLHQEDYPEMVQAYKTDQEVQGLFTNIIEPLADVKVLESLYVLYLSPNVDNRCFGYSNEELRDKMKLSTNRELYLAYFVILSLLAMFYGEDSLSEVSRSYVTVSDLEQFVSNRLQDLKTNPELPEVEKELEINLLSSVELWQDMPEYDPDLKSLRRSTKNRISFILKVAKFLEAEGLAHVEQDRELYATEKTEQMVRKYYSDRGRQEKLLTLLCARKETP